MKFQINFIAHTRQENLTRICEEIYKIDDDLKSQIQINVLNDIFCKKNVIDEIENKFRQSGIVFNNYIQLQPCYIDKCRIMSESKADYIIKYDEDIFLTTEAWNNFLSDADKIDWNKTACYAPLINTGIPSIVKFLDYFCDADTRSYFRMLFEQIKIENMWGANFESLNYSKENPYDFFDQVNKLTHYYKGIHPLRVSSEIQNLLVDYVLSNSAWKNPKIKDNLLQSNPAYFCNSAYMMPTSFYKEAYQGMMSEKYVMDGFDEVGLNQYVSDKNKNFVFNLNSVAVHPSYNTIGMIYNDISKKFFSNI